MAQDIGEDAQSLSTSMRCHSLFLLTAHDVVHQGPGLDGREELLGLVRPERARPHGRADTRASK